MSQAPTRHVVELAAADLQGPGVVPCPAPNRGTPWASHPKVYVDVVSGGEGKCPYCGTVYRLKPGEQLHGHH